MRIALLSDIHFGLFSRSAEFSVPGESIEDESKGGHSLEEDLKKLLKSNGVEYIFVAGDLTSIGSPQEFFYCEKKILEIADYIGIPIENIIYTVGNHDIDWKISDLVDVTTSEKTLTSVKELTEEHYQFIAANAASLNLQNLIRTKDGIVPSSGVYDTNDFIVFILNSSLKCSHKQKIPHGKLTTNQLDWFESKASEYVSDERIKIVLMHHHPMNYPYHIPSFDVSMIEEGSELITIAGKYGIDLILHGHRHHPTALTRIEDTWIHPIAFVCAGSVSVNAKHRDNGEIPNTVHILQIDKEERDIVLFNYKFSSAEGWSPIDKRTREVPLDKEMWLGRIPDEKEVREYLSTFYTKNHVFQWERLPKNMKYISMEKLTQTIIDFYPNHIVTGAFPNDTSIIRKDAI